MMGKFALGALVLVLGGAWATAFFQQGSPKAKPVTAGVGRSPGGAIEGTADYLKRARDRGHELAMFGAGCFWCVEDDYRRTPGVIATAVGYSGGSTDRPTYKQVGTGATGHAEVVLIEFDPKKISYEKVVRLFFEFHDPTQLNRQGPDVGTQYRSAIFGFDATQLKTAEKIKAELGKKVDPRYPIVTEIAEARRFWPAEDYHQQYYEKNGIGH